MIEKTFDTSHGTIHYWINSRGACKGPQLVFLPGLTADHRLFDKQIEYFEGRYPVFVWDAPGAVAIIIGLLASFIGFSAAAIRVKAEGE